MGQTKERESNIELYRIIVMLLIIAHHYVVNSGLLGVNCGPIFENFISFKSIFLLIFGAWGKIGINCFVLITGYFMCTSKITPKKFLKLFGTVIFYKLLIYLIFLATSYTPFSIKDLVYAVVPIISVASGFTEAYLLFFLTIPFLNILIKNLTEKQHLLLILLMSFIYIFFGTLPFFHVSMNYVSWFSVLYFIASYIRIYPKKIFSNTKFWGIATLISLTLSLVSIIAGIYIGQRIGRDLSHYFVSDSNTLLAVMVGLSSFMFFKNLKIKKSRAINTISSTCFGVLQIHANSDAMRLWLWGSLLKTTNAYYSNYTIPHAIISVILVFAACSIIEFLRIQYIEKPFFRLWDKHSEKLYTHFKSKKNKSKKSE